MSLITLQKRVEELEKRQHQPDFIQPPRWMTSAEAEPIIEKELIERLKHPQETAEEDRRQRAEGVPEWVFSVWKERTEKYLRKQETLAVSTR